ncbi:MAG: histidine kinase dimerization/phosphoacceptor domain -containing protein [Pseudomonadota bacterium]
MKNRFSILFLLFCSLISQGQHTEILDSLEHKVMMSEGVERCQQLVKLFRAFENQPDVGGMPFPESYYTYVDECITIAESENEINLLNSLRISKAALYIRDGKHIPVIELINTVLATNMPLNVTDSMDAYVFLMRSYIHLGLYDKALKNAMVKAQLAQRLGRLDVVIENNTEIASVYYNMGVFDLARLYFLKNLGYHLVDSNYYMIANNYNNLGLTHTKLGNLDSALIQYNNAKTYALKYYEKHTNNPRKDFFLSLIDGNMGEVYIAKGKYNLGIKLLQKDIASSRRFGYFDNVANCYVQLSMCYQLKNNPVTALKYIDSAYNILNKQEILTSNKIISVGERKAHILLDLKDFEQAAFLFHDIYKLKDSLQSDENRKNALISNSAYQVYEKENELKLHKVNLIEAETRHKLDMQQRNILYLLVFVLFTFAGLSFFAFKQKKKDHRQLKSQKQEIESQKKLIESNLDEKELLLKEIQHRVKNNLQVISGMLQLQASNFDDPEVCRVMEEGQARIKAMAIIHQQLYQKGDNLKYISFNSYLKDLTNQIAGSYKEISKKVTIEIDAENIQFDVKTAIPLGIIINELLSNAFKYAFNERKQGSINISIHPKGDHEYTLIVKDNGIGLPKDFNLNEVNSLGLKLVKILCKQMRGSFDFKNGEGSSFIISFKDNVTV